MSLIRPENVTGAVFEKNPRVYKNITTSREEATNIILKDRSAKSKEYGDIQDGNRQMKDMYLILRERSKF